MERLISVDFNEEDIEKELADNNLQLAENEDVEDGDDSNPAEEKNDYEKKRENLKATKISRQTWSIIEIYKKLDNKSLILNPEYQRNVVWQRDKRTAFIESLYMGIMIPPIYVVEVPGESILDEIKYEVVDGKQRLTAIQEYLQNKLVLKKQSLEYYADIFSEKRFEEIKDIAEAETARMLSSILDIYVITASSPEATKYDIFARLNKGAEKLKVNEIRRAIYHSDVTSAITDYVEQFMDKTDTEKYSKYRKIFTNNDIKRYEDYGRFYRSVAYYMRTNTEKCIVEGYNSRPRDMINNVLQSFQNKEISIKKEELNVILDATIKLRETINMDNKDYVIDACIPFMYTMNNEIINKIPEIINKKEFLDTLVKSPSTTNNVNKRISIIKEALANGAS